MPEYYSINPQTYDDQFWWKKDDIEFWKSLLIFPNANILELAAGTGRLAAPFLREGVQYTGLELSKEYVTYANLKFPFSKPILLGDMKHFNLEQSYDFVFIGFNSLLHLLFESDVVHCLQSIKRHMHANTKLYIDIFMPHASFMYRDSSSPMVIMEFFDSLKNHESKIEESIDYNSDNEIISVIWDYKNNYNKSYQKFKFKMKAYYPDTLNRLLIDNGFIIHNLWGGYDMSHLNEDSSLQIYELGI